MFSPGQRLSDRFTLVERIGAGGMSEVWRATDELLGRDVAVKVLLSPLLADPPMRAATWREARAAARINHPGVTQVHDYGEVPLPTGETAGYLVMELVQGQTLAQRLARGPLPWQEVVRIGAQVAAALAAAHKLGVVHRDIKPGNVMLTDDGVKVLDFGIAAVAGRVGEDPGRLLGTPRYAAPERFDGGPTQPASDVYSLGVLLYEALAGPAAVPSADLSGAAAAAATPPPPLEVPGLPEPVARLCQQCRAPDPAHRPPAAQVAAVLAEATGAAVSAAPTVPLAAAGSAAPTPPGTRLTEPQRASGDPPTLVDVPATRVDPVPPAPRRRGRRLATAAGAVALLVLVLVVAAALRPDGSGPGTAPDPVDVGAAPGSADPGGRSGAGTTGPPLHPVRGPETVLAELERTLTELEEQGILDPDTAADLRDDLADVRKALTEPPGRRGRELREGAEDLREEIEELREDGALDQAAADHLLGLLTPLLGA